MPRACLKNAFRKMYVTICVRFCPDEGVVAGYGNRIRAKYTAKRGVQIAGMIFQTRSSILPINLAFLFPNKAVVSEVVNGSKTTVTPITIIPLPIMQLRLDTTP